MAKWIIETSNDWKPKKNMVIPLANAKPVKWVRSEYVNDHAEIPGDSLPYEFILYVQTVQEKKGETNVETKKQ